MPGAESFPKELRLRRRVDFVEVQRKGRKVQSDHFLLFVLAAAVGMPARRIGLTVSSKVGNAVVRNRLKRWLRDYVRKHKEAWPVGDSVIVAKSSAATPPHALIDRDLEKLFRRAQGPRP